MPSRSVLPQLLFLLFKLHNSRSSTEAGLGNGPSFPTACFSAGFPAGAERRGCVALSCCSICWQPCASPLLCCPQPTSLFCLLSTQRGPALASRRDCKANNNELQSK